MTILGGTLKKSIMNTIPFSPEMRTLAYVMILNLYPVTNLTVLSAPRTIFLYDLFTHKEIDICGHIFHLLTKNIEKQNSRIVMQRQGLNFQVASLWYKEMCLQYHEIVLSRRWRDSPLLQRLQLSHHLQHQHEGPTNLIISLLE